MSFRFQSLLLPVLALAACGKGTPKPAADTTVAQQPDTAITAPDQFRVRFETSRGPFVVEAHRSWAPNGVDRFYKLVKSGYYDGNRFFRVVPGFMAQFGLHGEPSVSAAWEPLTIPDDPVVQSNKRGFVSFATRGANTRTTQLFINFADNSNLDGMGFAPFAQVVEGMPVVDSLYGGYGDGPPSGNGPDQGRIRENGNAYLEKDFPRLDFIRTARVMENAVADSAAKGTTVKP